MYDSTRRVLMKSFLSCIVCALIVLGAVDSARTQEMKPIELLEPQKAGGMPLMEALENRRSGREYGVKMLPPQVLSNLLWAAFGINRPEDGKRTAPSAMNRQEIDIYVALAKGLYLYDAEKNSLIPVLPDDLRALTGKQDFVSVAPVNLVYVADYSRMGDMPDEVKAMYSAANAGFISENVYLYCASEGLVTVVRGYVDKEELGRAMKLGPERHIVFAQTVGYPVE
jgi:SagB-type dehydrogenase family enzyme